MYLPIATSGINPICFAKVGREGREGGRSVTEPPLSIVGKFVSWKLILVINLCGLCNLVPPDTAPHRFVYGICIYSRAQKSFYQSFSSSFPLSSTRIQIQAQRFDNDSIVLRMFVTRGYYGIVFLLVGCIT